jgi:sterol desaturase/sphingolipid hydroxylase (fatty acid hydroxylase superfamily)
LSGTHIVLGTVLLVAALEIARPWRPVKAFAGVRWVSNLALLVLTWGLDFLLSPVIAIVAVADLEFGLPFWVQLAVGVTALDAASYALHRMLHSSAILWRLHALHHADPELDISTTVRHHPGESLFMALAITAVSAAIGLPALVIGIYASLNMSVQLFAHANISLPRRLTSGLGWLLVTPGLHRVHHSRQPADLATNYGLVFSVWDRLFGTYRRESENGEDAIEFGIERFREQHYQRLDRMLWLPLIAR